MATEWEIDCIYWLGRVLNGKYAHWCHDWDDLPIDETCTEFTGCHCYDQTEEIKSIKADLWEQFDADWKGRKNEECVSKSRKRVLQ